MAGFDPATDPRVQQAVNADRAMRGLPPLPEPGMSASPSAQDAIAMQDAALAQQAIDDAAMSGVGQQAPPEALMSPPPPAPVDMSAPENQPQEALAWQPPEALMSPAPPAAQQTQPQGQQRQYTPQELAILFGRQRQGGGVANPVPQMLADTTTRRQEAEAASKGYERLGDEATAEAQQAAADLGQVRSDAASQIAEIQQRTAAEGEQHIAKLADIQDSYDKASARVEDEQRQIGEFIGSYEPKDRRTMTQRVMGALAVGLGQMTDQNNLVAGLMQGMSVQTNNADATAALIQRGIDRDIDLQRQMLDNKRTALAAKTTELGQVRERFGDSVDTLKLARAMKLDQAIQEMESVKSRGMSGEALALADQTIASLTLERANTLMSVKEQNFQRLLGQEQQLKMLRYQQSQPRTMSAKDKLDLEGKALANEKARRELEGGGADANGAYGMQALPGAKPSEKGTQEAQKLVSATEGIRATISQLRGMAAKGATLSPTERATARRRLQSIKSQFNGVFGDGTAPNEAQLQAMDEIFSNPTEVNMSDVAKTLEVFDRDAVEMTNAKIRPYGFRLEDINVRPE